MQILISEQTKSKKKTRKRASAPRLLLSSTRRALLTETEKYSARWNQIFPHFHAPQKKEEKRNYNWSMRWLENR